MASMIAARVKMSSSAMAVMIININAHHVAVLTSRMSAMVAMIAKMVRKSIDVNVQMSNLRVFLAVV